MNFQGKGEQTTFWLISEDPVQKSERNIIRNRLLSNCGLVDEYGGNFLKASPNSLGSHNRILVPPAATQQIHRLSNHSNDSNRSSSRNKFGNQNGTDGGELDRSSVRSDAVVYDLFRSSENASIRRGSSRKSFILGIDALFRVGSPPHNEAFNNGNKDDRRQKWGFKSQYSNSYLSKPGRSTGTKLGSCSDRFLKVPLSTKASSFKCSPTSSSHSATSLQRNSLTDENTWLRTRPKTASNRIVFKNIDAARANVDSTNPLI